MPFIRAGTQQLFYAQRDRGSAYNLVFVHGAGGDHTIWGHQLAHVSQANPYALDLPGHGRSDGPGYASIPNYRDAVLGFLDALSLQRVILAGHSMGGAIAQSFALTYPDRLAGLILAGTGARLRVLPALLEGFLKDFPATARQAVRLEYAPDTPAERLQAAEAELLRVPPEVVHADFRACDGFDVMGQLGRVSVPALVLVGTADQMTPVKYALYLEANIPGAELVLIEGAGHMLMVEKPEAVTAAINQFIAARFGSE